MAYHNLAGRNPQGVIRLFAIRIPSDLVNEYRQRAEADGWTELKLSQYEGIEITSLESSDETPSTKKKSRRSSRSVGRSRDSAA